jgi:hypothetical protein
VVLLSFSTEKWNSSFEWTTNHQFKIFGYSCFIILFPWNLILYNLCSRNLYMTLTQGNQMINKSFFNCCKLTPCRLIWVIQINPINFLWLYAYVNRSQWPRGLRHEPSSVRTVGSWVPIPLEARMPVFAFILCLCKVAALRRADLPSKKSYRGCIELRNRRRGQDPTKGCRAIDE